MTENEAIKVLNDEDSYGYELNKACLIAIKALSEIQQYRAIGTVEDIQEVMALCKSLQETVCRYMNIGTVEEFKALKEKSVAKKVIVKKSEKIELDVCDEKGNVHLCPNCNDYIICADMKHCLNCGQALEH